MSAFRSLSPLLITIALLAALLGAAAAPALADGKVFATQVADTSGAQIPDQSALICWKDGVETLAIETRFIGRGTDFAWVVPLPSRPEVTPATKGTFPTLRAMFAPVVKSYGFGLVVPLVLITLVVIILLYVRPWLAVAMITVFVVIPGTFFLLPTLGTARSSIGAAIPDVLVDQRLVGDFEVSTLESPDGAAVTGWLRTHSFHVSQNEESVINQHAREGWSFVATRLRRGSDSAEPSTAHPLVFTFATPHPIYPMRLTGADATRDLSVELFVFGPSRAAAERFAINAAAPLSIVDTPDRWRVIPLETHINVAHKAVCGLIRNAAYGTRLTTILSPAQMTQDIQLRWTDRGGSTGRRAHDRDGVTTLAIEAGLATALCVLIGIGIAERRKRAPRGTALAVSTLAGVLLGGVVALAVPAVASVRVLERNRAIDDVLDDMALEAKDRLPISQARDRFDRIVSRHSYKPGAPPLSIGDAPGQYDLRARDGIIWLIAHDAAGAENWTHLCATDDPDSE